MTSNYTKLNLVVKPDMVLQRRVLVEKFDFNNSQQIAIENFFWKKLKDSEIFINKKEYPDSTFYFKKNKAGKYEFLMERHEKERYFYIRYYNFWEKIEQDFKLQYNEIQLITMNIVNSILEEGVNSKPFKTYGMMMGLWFFLEEGVNSKPFKTLWTEKTHPENLEEGVNSKPFKTNHLPFIFEKNLEEGVNSKPFKTALTYHYPKHRLEEGVNSKPFKTHSQANSHQTNLEEGVNSKPFKTNRKL